MLYLQVNKNKLFRNFAYSLLLISVLASCKKETVVRYQADMDAEFDLPTGLNTVETHYFIIRDVPTNYKLNADLKGVDTSSIFNVQASKGLLKSKFGGVDFDFINRISVYAVSKKDPSKKREMFYLEFVPVSTGPELKMLSSTTQLKEILRDELIDMEVRINLRSFTTSAIRARLEFGYAVF